MLPKSKFVIGKSKSSRLTLEQRILGYNRQLTKLNNKVDLISAWLTKKFGVTFLVEASARVELKDMSKYFSMLKSTAPRSANAREWKAKEKPQSASGGQHSGSDVSSEESDIMVDLDSDSDVNETDKDVETSAREAADDPIPLKDSVPGSERGIQRQRKSKIQRNKLARLQVGAKHGQEGNGTKKQLPRSTLADQNYQTQDKGRAKHSCNWPNCSKYFGQKSHLVEHQRTHTGVKPFKCTWPNCGKSFSLSHTCTKHRRTHTGENPYLCNWPDCDKSFCQSDGLQVHTIRAHTGERSYNCGFCGHRFTTGSELAIHIRVHTGEKPYKCGVCAAAFAQSYGKVQHEKTHHRSH